MKPTSIGTPVSTSTSTETTTRGIPATLPADQHGIAVQAAQPAFTAITQTAISLRPDQLAKAEEQLGKLNFNTIAPAEIALIGHEAEAVLTQTLDGFLTGIERARNPQLFALFDRLQTGVTDAKLPDLLKQIQSGKLGIKARMRGLFSKKALADAAHEAYVTTCDLVSGRTNTLSGVMKGLEAELSTALSTLLAELKAFDGLQSTYRTHIDDFAVAAAVTQAFLGKARLEIERDRAQLVGSTDPLALSDLEQKEHKLQLLESRALALEGVYSRLPADRLVIQQIQAAGVQTLQETANTATTRFSSIKTTLIALHGALQVKGVQQLTAKHAALDAQLGEIRGQLMRDVVTTAANAPGDNRLQQATELQKLITITGEIQSLVTSARESNKTKFETARAMFADARLTLTQLSNQPKA